MRHSKALTCIAVLFLTTHCSSDMANPNGDDFEEERDDRESSFSSQNVNESDRNDSDDDDSAIENISESDSDSDDNKRDGDDIDDSSGEDDDGAEGGDGDSASESSLRETLEINQSEVIDFGTVSTDSPFGRGRAIVLTNISDDEIDDLRLSVAGDKFSFLRRNCVSIPASESCTETLFFAPNQESQYAGRLTVSRTSDPENAEIFRLKGQGNEEDEK